MTETKTRQLAELAIRELAIRARGRAVVSKEVGTVMEAIINPAVGMETSKVNKESHGVPAIGMTTNEIRKENRGVLIIGMTTSEASKGSHGTTVIGMTANKDLINKAPMKIAAETPGRISLVNMGGILPVPFMID